MQLWVDGAHDARENMRRDAALLAAAELGAPTVVRLYRFAPPGITLGMNQVAERVLDLERCARDGVIWSTRPTGGRAIFHGDEWTYAVASPLAPMSPPLAEYERWCGVVARALRRLGAPVALARGTRSDATLGGTRGPAPCFASTARHEVVIAGKKLVGAAQRRTRTALLHQGSILLGEGHLRLADYLPGSDAERIRAREDLARRAATLGAWVGAEAPVEDLALALTPELGSRVCRFDAAEGLALLTLPESGSYTSPLFAR